MKQGKGFSKPRQPFRGPPINNKMKTRDYGILGVRAGRTRGSGCFATVLPTKIINVGFEGLGMRD